MPEEKIYISLEQAVNNVCNRHHMSKAQKEVMYREWANLNSTGKVKFDEKDNIIGFAPDASIEKIDMKIMIHPESGEVEVV